MNLSERIDLFSRTDIYPVLTPEFCCGRPFLEILEAVLAGGARIVQLRDKEDPNRFAADFRRLTDNYNALLIINDSPEAALEIGADGVHLGQEDPPVSEARKRAPDLLIGASTHNLSQALTAQKNGASYVNIGPIFPTKTKERLTDFVGCEAIKEVSPYLAIPFTVMGGINTENIEKVLAAGARHIAMITTITQADNVIETTRLLIQKIRSYK
ncbi:MAG: thiamine phosphate synthase [Candidatus Omnitrophota bacterium]|nr:thiamine phosphate synthase [Candidatus Omnitrophota bacterium]